MKIKSPGASAKSRRARVYNGSLEGINPVKIREAFQSFPDLKVVKSADNIKRDLFPQVNKSSPNKTTDSIEYHSPAENGEAEAQVESETSSIDESATSTTDSVHKTEENVTGLNSAISSAMVVPRENMRTNSCSSVNESFTKTKDKEGVDVQKPPIKSFLGEYKGTSGPSASPAPSHPGASNTPTTELERQAKPTLPAPKADSTTVVTNWDNIPSPTKTAQLTPEAQDREMKLAMMRQRLMERRTKINMEPEK